MVAAVMLCKDEADIVGFTIEHLLEQLDRVYVADNLSTDGTTGILVDLRDKHGADRVRLTFDDEIGYWQSRKTTELAMLALEDGFHWVLPVDADEFWHAADYSRTIKQFLEGTPPDVQMVRAELFNHLPTAADPPASCPHCDGTGRRFVPAGDYVVYEVDRVDEGSYVLCEHCRGEVDPNPFRRLGWRQREHAPLGKIACRLRPDLVIHAGNHGASTTGTALTGTGLVVRHFSWRSAEQYCNPPEAPIWMGDLTFKEIGDVAVGDEIIGWGRTPAHRKVHLMPGYVTEIHTRQSPIVRVDFESGRSLRCSPDHLWHQYHYRFRGEDRSGLGTFKPAKPGRSLTHVITPSFPASGDDAWLAGWLAGMFDGEGHRNQIAQSQSVNPDLYEAICDALTHFGLPFTRQTDRVSLVGGRQTYVDFANIVRPKKRSTWVAWQSAARGIFGKLGTPDKIVNVEPCGDDEVIGLTTTTGCYVAWGYASKNCRKIRNGEAAYAATDLPEDVGKHWRMFVGKPDEAIADCFRRWYWSADPGSDTTLINDPAPGA